MLGPGNTVRVLDIVPVEDERPGEMIVIDEIVAAVIAGRGGASHTPAVQMCAGPGDAAAGERSWPQVLASRLSNKAEVLHPARDRRLDAAGSLAEKPVDEVADPTEPCALQQNNRPKDQARRPSTCTGVSRRLLMLDQRRRTNRFDRSFHCFDLSPLKQAAQNAADSLLFVHYFVRSEAYEAGRR